jgi:hypothetical protein
MQRLRRWFWDIWEPGRHWLGLLSLVGGFAFAVVGAWATGEEPLFRATQSGLAFCAAAAMYSIRGPRKRRSLAALVWLAAGLFDIALLATYPA